MVLKFYRNDSLLTQVIGDSTSFEDYTGEPDSVYTYEVVAFVNRAGEPFPSGIDALIPSVSETFPKLLGNTYFKVNQNLEEGSLEIHLDYELPGADGFYIERYDIANNLFTVLDTLNEPSPLADTLIYIDRTGVPNSTYVYDVRAFSERNGTTYVDVNCSEFATYPPIPTPQNLTASQGTFSQLRRTDMGIFQ